MLQLHSSSSPAHFNHNAVSDKYPGFKMIDPLTHLPDSDPPAVKTEWNLSAEKGSETSQSDLVCAVLRPLSVWEAWPKPHSAAVCLGSPLSGETLIWNIIVT